jgi:drug/metabolite transporter (DMT)-like permease
VSGPVHYATLTRQGLILLALITVFWGFNWPILKIAIAEIPICTFRSLCVAGGALGLLLIARWKSLSTDRWPPLIGASYTILAVTPLVSTFGGSAALVFAKRFAAMNDATAVRSAMAMTPPLP